MLQQTPEAPPARPGRDPREARKIRVEGDETAVRSATLDMGGLIANIRAVEDPDPEGMEDYRAGVHLIKALHNESGDFGLASPDVEPEADIAEQIMGITDEAFEAAEDFLMLAEALEYGGNGGNGGNGARNPESLEGIRSSQICALLLEMKRLSIRDEMRVMESLRPATDRRLGRIGGEFF